MTAQTWVSIALAVIAAASLGLTARAVKAATKQTEIQEQGRKDAAQPYVWADLRPDPPQRGLLLLVVGNSGPTVATDVRVRIDPPLQDHSGKDRTPAIARLRNNGIGSLPPGRVMEWILGPVHAHMPQTGEAIRYRVEITANGPFGPLEPNSYWIDLEDLHSTWAAGEGSMRLISKSIDDAAKLITRVVEKRSADQQL